MAIDLLIIQRLQSALALSNRDGIDVCDSHEFRSGKLNKNQAPKRGEPYQLRQKIVVELDTDNKPCFETQVL